tara:strand:+ start:198 stop:1292 length:1095 start_codon:yes stop_codon:yes gene_type:complete
MTYLIFRNDGIGDLIVSTPLIKLIKIYDKDPKIHLVCSNRNVEYAYLLKLNKLIDDYTNIDEYRSFLKKIKFYLKIKAINVHHIIILRSSHINILMSLLLKYSFQFTKRLTISSIVPLNLSKKGKNRYKPSRYLINSLFDHYEIIDGRNDYLKSKHIQMFEHYTNLGNKALKSEISTNDVPYFVPQLLLNEEMFIEATEEILKKNKFMVFHFDEKWNSADYSINEIINLINGLLEAFNGYIFITHGLFKNKYFDLVKNEYQFKSNISSNPNCKIYHSVTNKRLFSFNSLKLNELMFLISKSNLVIEQHGALTHLASIYKIPVIDLMTKNRINFLSKWKPRDTKMKQLIIDDKEDILKKMKEFIT